jgi:NDP-sugar pyrophosphorylase family protein
MRRAARACASAPETGERMAERSHAGERSFEAPRAMIMAAGLGTRLWPLTDMTAKPMVPVVNCPVMEHLVRLLRGHGITRLSANLHHYPEAIETYFDGGRPFGVELEFRVESELLGTAGGVGNFRDVLGGSTFLVMSGDALTDVDLTAFLAHHRARGGIATMAVKQVADPSSYGVVVHDGNGRVTGFQEKPSLAEAASDLCNCGIYAFEPAIFDYVPPGAFVDWATDVFPRLLAEERPVHVWRVGSYWNDVGSIEAYRAGNFDALRGRVAVQPAGREVAPGVWVGDGTELSAGLAIEPPVLLGRDCVIEPGVTLTGPLIVGDRCIIESGAVLEGVIHWHGCKTGRNARNVGAIVGGGVFVHNDAQVREGAVIGERCVVEAGAVVPEDARIEAGRVVPAGRP